MSFNHKNYKIQTFAQDGHVEAIDIEGDKASFFDTSLRRRSVLFWYDYEIEIETYSFNQAKKEIQMFFSKASRSAVVKILKRHLKKVPKQARTKLDIKFPILDCKLIVHHPDGRQEYEEEGKIMNCYGHAPYYIRLRDWCDFTVRIWKRGDLELEIIFTDRKIRRLQAMQAVENYFHTQGRLLVSPDELINIRSKKDEKNPPHPT